MIKTMRGKNKYATGALKTDTDGHHVPLFTEEIKDAKHFATVKLASEFRKQFPRLQDTMEIIMAEYNMAIPNWQEHDPGTFSLNETNHTFSMNDINELNKQKLKQSKQEPVKDEPTIGEPMLPENM